LVGWAACPKLLIRAVIARGAQTVPCAYALLHGTEMERTSRSGGKR